jgi:hypothetical protein
VAAKIAPRGCVLAAVAVLAAFARSVSAATNAPVPDVSPSVPSAADAREYRRAAGLSGLGFLVGSVAYWSIDENTIDYDYEAEPATLVPKLVTLDAWRFDDNQMWLNSPGHPFAGAWYYLLGRACGFGRWGSFGLLVASDLLWETAVEFREVTSINDLALTLSGVAVGEAAWQAGPRGDSGARSRFDVEAGGGVTGMSSAAGARPAGGFRVQTPAAPAARRCEGSRLAADGVVADDGIAAASFFADTTLAGWRVRDAVGDPRTGRWGHEAFAGAATAFEHSYHRYDGDGRHAAVASLLGPALRMAWYGGRVRLRACLDLYGDFAAVDSHAVEAYGRSHDLRGVKSPLRQWGYYNALGGTARPGLTLAAEPFELILEARYHCLDSIEGRDRRQEQITDDTGLVDRDVRQTVTAAWTTPWHAARMSLSYEDARRSGQMGRVRRDSTDGTVLLSLGRTL